MMKGLLRVVFVLLLASLFTSLGAIAQGYPAKPVRVVIPWPPGGSNDVVGRLVLQKLSEWTGQQFVVDNRAGASGSIGSDVVAKATPDGYTIMIHSTTHLGNAHLYKKLPYDTLKDFTGVALLSAQPGVLTVHPSLPAKSMKEFIALAKSRPGQILYSSSGNGSAPHLQMALLISMTGINITHVPYKGGVPQVAALVSGETQASFATISTVVSHIRNGKLRPLGVGSARPSRALPGVPTISDSGVPGYEMAPWIGVFAPAGTPKPIVGRLNAEINKALAQPDIVQKLENQALDPLPSTTEEFNARIKTDYEKYGKLIKLTGAKIE
ncbi:MAG: tripartite tricarboxylate transporter substrate binding protein [Betaproteobacteria bacterium]|nr:tripartite tricarboxylate transporter substrate binding protein [Betaproteobacteria bacterium]